MKKIMRIALVFALAGATLVGCTKDYSGDISDLNKKVSEQQSAVTALQTAVSNAQQTADRAVSDAAAALAEAKAKATPAEVAAVEQKIDALIAGDVKDLKDWKVSAQTELERIAADYVTKVQLAQDLASLKAELEQADATNAQAIKDLEKKVNELVAKCYVDFTSIDAPAAVVDVTYKYANFNPNASTKSSETYKALKAAFPEIADIEGKNISRGGHVPFSVNPDSFEFDSTFTFTLVDVKGTAYPGTLSNPVKGLVGAEVYTAGHMETKAAADGYWTLSLAPVCDEDGEFNNDKKGLSLVVTKDEESARTPFAYNVKGNQVRGRVTITLNPTKHEGFGRGEVDKYCVDFAEEIDLVNAKAVFDGEEWEKPIVTFANEMEGFYIVSATDTPENSLKIEEYGVKFVDNKIVINNYPENENFIEFGVNVKVLGYTGSVANEDFTLTVWKEAETEGFLEAKTVTYAVDSAKYEIRWDLADYGFTKAQTEKFVNAEHQVLYFYQKDSTKQYKDAVVVNFYDENGSETEDWSKATTFGFDIEDESMFAPGEYDVIFKVFNDDEKWWVYTIGAGNTVYKAESTFTVENDPEIAPEKLISILPQICDKAGVVQAVGESNGENVSYSFNEHPVIVTEEFFDKTNDIEIVGYKDLDATDDCNWLTDPEKIKFPADGKFISTKDNKVVRNVAVVIKYFGDANNMAEYPFQISVLSPVEGGINFAETLDDIYFPSIDDEDNTIDIKDFFKKAKVTYGTEAGLEFSVKAGDEHFAKYIKSVKVTLNAEDAKTADRFIKKGAGEAFEWGISESIEAINEYTIADIPEGKVTLRATATVVDKWGLKTTSPEFTITIKAEK